MSIAGFFGSVFWVVDLTASFRPQQAVVLVVLGTIALLGDKRVALVVIAVGLLNAAVVAPYVIGVLRTSLGMPGSK